MRNKSLDRTCKHSSHSSGEQEVTQEASPIAGASPPPVRVLYEYPSVYGVSCVKIDMSVPKCPPKALPGGMVCLLQLATMLSVKLDAFDVFMRPMENNTIVIKRVDVRRKEHLAIILIILETTCPLIKLTIVILTKY